MFPTAATVAARLVWFSVLNQAPRSPTREFLLTKECIGSQLPFIANLDKRD